MDEFSKLNKDLIIYITKVMEIYKAMCKKDDSKAVRAVMGEQQRDFSRTDRKALAFLLASFISDTRLSELLSEYKDSVLPKLYKFMDLEESEIVPLKDNAEYAKFYNEELMYDIHSFINRLNWSYKVKTLSPEVIYYAAFSNLKVNGSDALNYFSREIGLGHWFNEHPSIEKIRTYIMSKGYMINTNDKEVTENQSERVKTKTANSETTQTKIIDFSTLKSEKTWELLESIKKKFVGQEKFAEHLFYNIINNQQIAGREDALYGERAIIFVDWPTGTGKTAITRTITDNLGIPLIPTSITSFSSTGCKGGSLPDTLKRLYNKAGGNLEAAERGIIIFDEFDKISSKGDMGLEMKKAVQQELLDFMGGGKYVITVGDIFDAKEIEFDTSKLTFICLGALTNLTEQKTKIKNSIGFNESNDFAPIEEYTITPDDLHGMGIEKELVGRLNTYLHTNPYTKHDLYRIFTESTISPMKGLASWIEFNGKKLEVGPNVNEAIVDIAYELNTGARSLQTVMNNTRTMFLEQVLKSKDQTDDITKVRSALLTRRNITKWFTNTMDTC